MKTIPILIRLRGSFARNKEEFWWKYFTDDELELRRMDVWELAGVIQEARVRGGMETKLIVAEHMLNVRLAQVQAKASWGSGVLGFLGALVGSALSVVLAAVLQREPKTGSLPAQHAYPAPTLSSASVASHGTATLTLSKPATAQPPSAPSSNAVQR